MTLKEEGDRPRRENRAERKRSRQLKSLESTGFDHRASEENDALLAADASEPSMAVPSAAEAGEEDAPEEAANGERETRRAKIIALTRATLKPLSGGLESADAKRRLPAEVGIPGPRLLAGPLPRAHKSHWMRWSALVVIVLPTLIASVYYIFFASSQYYSEGRFAVRTAETVAASTDSSGILASLGLGSSTPTIADSYIVVDYLESRRLVEDLQSRLDIRKLFSRPEADWYARLNPNVPVEKLVTYWQGMTHAYFDSMTGIVQFSVRAFTPEDAQKIAAAALESAERLINDLSKRAREDTLQFAKDDLSRAELRLRFARKGIREFRNREKQIDPTAIAASRMSVLSGLEGELAKQESDRATVNSFLNSTAPSVVMMQNRIDALRKRISEERSKLGSVGAADDSDVMSSVFAEFEELETDRTFSEELYKSALAGMEGARIAAERKMRYVTSFVVPNRPEMAEYPTSVRNIIMVFLACFITWIVGVLVVFGIRDHTV